MTTKKTTKTQYRYGAKTPLRKPPRLDGKEMNRGIKNVRKKKKNK